MLKMVPNTIYMQTAGLVVIKNRKLLLAFSNNKQAYYLPGGKVHPFDMNCYALQPQQVPGVVMILKKLQQEGSVA